MKVLLQEVRKSKGLSQNELARLIHMSPQNIQKIEQGEAKSLTFETLRRLCKILGCQPGELLIYEDEPRDNDRQSAISLGDEFKEENKQTELMENRLPRSQQRTGFLSIVSQVPQSA